jgi:calcineurin-like phosphoesterase family protein
VAYPVYTFGLQFPTAAWKTADRSREFASAFGCDVCDDLKEILLPVSIRPTTGDEGHLRDELEDVFSSTGPLRGILEGWHVRRAFLKRYVTVELRNTSTLSEFTGRVQTIPDTAFFLSPGNMSADICELRSSGDFFAIAESLQFPLSGMERVLKKFIRTSPDAAGYARPLLLPVDITRVRVLKDGVPWRLYDLALGRWIEPADEKSREYLAESCRELRRVRGYDISPCYPPTPAHPGDRGPALSADLHLGHNGVINYYSRPFPPHATAEMDDVLIGNWNASLEPDRQVYYLGDFTYKADLETNLAYQARLNGKITWIRGNHDIFIPEAEDSVVISYGGIDFLLIHNPKHVPASWTGWVIHGHTHNNRLNEYPFFSGEGKTVNVSVEVTGYQPVFLADIMTLIHRFEAGNINSNIMLRDVP